MEVSTIEIVEPGGYLAYESDVVIVQVMGNLCPPRDWGDSSMEQRYLARAFLLPRVRRNRRETSTGNF